MAKVVKVVEIWATEDEYAQLAKGVDVWEDFLKTLKDSDGGHKCRKLKKLRKAVKVLDEELMEMGIE